MEKSLTPCFVRMLLTVAFLAVGERGKKQCVEVGVELRLL